ncbi:ERCC4-related helicase [Thermonema lapsum]|uniref:ERCC4-related helicase n=1 Tax=Thermonema lapsum TaxID=28195 RepID=A0A846MP02_9BACT|nr:hypothetical protein [Thermonema lapsum]NIK73199.1 ERCC4-related helicase [Thermonema lapsum]
MSHSNQFDKKALRKKLEQAITAVLAGENEHLTEHMKKEIKAAAKQLAKQYAKEQKQLLTLQEEAIQEAKEKLYEQTRQKVKEDADAQEINVEITFDLEELIAKKLPHLKDLIEEAFQSKRPRNAQLFEELRQAQEELQNILQEVLTGIFQTAKNQKSDEAKSPDETRNEPGA